MEGQELPVGWSSMELNDAGIWGSGGTPSRKNPRYYENGTISWLVIGDLNDQPVEAFSTSITELGLINSSAKLIPTGSLLVAMYGSIGKLGITTFPCTTNQAIAFCIPNEELVELRYLFHALANAKPELIAKGQGGAQQNISQGILKEHLIHLSPLNEQRRIAAKLDTTLADVDACRQRLDGVAAILKRFRQAVLAAATAGELTREWREERGIEMVTWRGYEFSSLVREARTGLVRSAAEQHELQEGLVPYLKMDSIGESWGCSHDDLKGVRCEDAEQSTYNLAYGDWLFNTRNSLELVGKSCVWEGPDGVVFNNNILRVRFTSTVRPQWIEIYLRSPGGRDILAAVKSATTSVAAIYQRSLMALEIQAPSLDEQSEIIDRVESFFTLADQLEARLNTARKIVDRLTPALLAKAFRGELVPQDPNDEPASVLLERIRAARQAEAGAGKASGRGRRKAAANTEPGPHPAAAATPDLLAQLLQECGALSERALLAASELDPGRFRRQLALEVEAGNIREELEGGQQVLMVAGES